MLRDPDSITLEALADYNVDKIEQDFEVLTIFFRDWSIDSNVIVRCKDYIGFEVIGLWDDSIVKSISIQSSGDFIKRSLEKVKELYCDPDNLIGCQKNTNNSWQQIVIRLIDGVEIKVACSSLEVDY